MKNKILILASIFFALNHISLYANDIDLEKIVVTPFRSKEQITYISRNVTIITSSDIEKSNAKTIPDILKTEAGISIYDYSGTGKNINSDMRGFGETGPSNMLVLIDGRRVNAIDLSGTDWIQIPLNQVERIEILRGAGSVAYGDNAVGGVVNIITKVGMGKPKIKIKQNYGSYNTKDTNVEIDGRRNNLSFYLNGTYFVTQGYRENNNLLRKDFGGKIGYKINDTIETQLSWGLHKDKYRLPGALRESQLKFGRKASMTPNDMADTKDYFSNLKIITAINNNSELVNNLSIRIRDTNSSYFTSSWKTENHIVTFGLTPKYTLNSNIFNHGNRLVLGFDYYNSRDNILDGFFTGANDTIHIKKKSYAGYLLDHFWLRDNLLTTLGYRYQKTQYKFDQFTQVETSAKSSLADDVYNIGLSYIYAPDSNIFTNFSTSFRYPLVDEYFTSNTWGTGGLNTALSAQTAKDYEIGIRHSFDKNLGLTFTYFRTKIDNEIYLNPTTYKNENYDRTLHEGIEIHAKFGFLDKIKLIANYTFTNAIFDGGNFDKNKIPAVPRHQSGIILNAQLTNRIDLNIITNYVSKMFEISDQSNDYEKMDDYAVTDIRLNYKVGNLEIFGEVNNVFNEQYSEYGVISTTFSERSFYPAPGRNFSFGSSIKF